MTYNAEELEVYLGLSFSTGETTGPEVPSMCVTLLACWGWLMQAECSHSSYPSNAVLLGLCGAWGGQLQPHPFVLGFLQWCLAYGYLPADLVRGTEGRNVL